MSTHRLLAQHRTRLPHATLARVQIQTQRLQGGLLARKRFHVAVEELAHRLNVVHERRADHLTLGGAQLLLRSADLRQRVAVRTVQIGTGRYHVEAQVLEIGEARRFLLLDLLEQIVLGAIARIRCGDRFHVAQNLLRPRFGVVGPSAQVLQVRIEFGLLGGAEPLLGELFVALG